jgi:hypothetical protein
MIRGGSEPNAWRQARREAEARYERTLDAVACTPWLEGVRSDCPDFALLDPRGHFYVGRHHQGMGSQKLS